MQKKLNSMPKKTLSIFMALFIVILSASFAFAADPIALTESNVTVWPTASGEIFFGQKISDGITLSGGEVQYNGTVVPGKFEFDDINYMPTKSGSQIANLNFIPENANEYTEFNVEYAWDVTYTVNKTNPVLVDETNMPIASNKVIAGKKLSTCILSGGTTIYNPYYPEEPKALAGTWKWTKSSTVVNESGFYEARILVTSYETVTTMVWVNIEGDDTQPVYPAEIIEKPTIAEITYNPDSTSTYDTLIQGGKAVIKGTETEVAGKFTVGESFIGRKPIPTDKKVTVIFTPDDPTIASWIQFEIPVKVNPASVSFKDIDGNSVVDDFVFKVEPNETMNNVLSRIKKSIIAPEKVVWDIEDINGYAENGRKYKVSLIYNDPNYTGTELYFTAKFKETELTPRFYAVGDGKWQVNCDKYSPLGTFTVYSILNGVETEIGEVKGNKTLEWKPVASGDYTFKVVYNPAEEDYFIINEVTTYLLENYPNRYFAATGTESAPYKMGATVSVKAPATDPAQSEKPYYGFIGWDVVSGNPDISDEQLASAEFEFKMPDENVELKANYKFSHKLYFKWVWQQIVEFFLFIGSAFKELFGMALVL